MYFYVKAVHIIFVVTWFSGLFYIVRLFVYAAEANGKNEPEKSILIRQYALMQRRLWYGITWPSAILTLILGSWMWSLYGSLPAWLLVKLLFVIGLIAYHLSLQRIFTQQQKNDFRWSSQKLRLWNEVATLFLFILVLLAVVKQLLNVLWAMVALVALSTLLFIAIRIYKKYRERPANKE